MPAARAPWATSRAVLIASATDLLMFFCEWLSVTERKTAASCRPAARARSRPFRLGTRAVKITSSRRGSRPISFSASASWGIHRGETKDDTSMRLRPELISASISRALSAVARVRSSFCSPSRGPTSYTSTRLGIELSTRWEFRSSWTLQARLFAPTITSVDEASNGAPSSPPTDQLHLEASLLTAGPRHSSRS